MIDTLKNLYETYPYFSMGIAAILTLILLIGLFSWIQEIMAFIGDLLIILIPIGILALGYYLWMNYL